LTTGKPTNRHEFLLSREAIGRAFGYFFVRYGDIGYLLQQDCPGPVVRSVKRVPPMIYSNQQAIAEQEGHLSSVLLTLRIITGAMVAGLGMFLIVVTLLVYAQKDPGPAAQVANPAVPADKTMPVLTVLALAGAAILLPLSVAIPGILSDVQRRKLASAKASPDDVPALIRTYQTKHIIALALTEAPGFFAIIVYMIEHNPIALALGALMIVFIAARFPIRARVEHWLDGQLDRLQNERRDASIA
jgi:hypothetical protein